MNLETGAINFCGKRALNIKSDDYKKYILDSLNSKYGVTFNKRNYQTYKPNHERLVKRFGDDGMLSVVSGGNAYLLYITKDEYSGKNMVLFIDCKVCEGYEYPRIILLWLRFKKDIYKDTLFRGELVRDRSSNWIFIIDDIVVHRGKWVVKAPKNERIAMSNSILREGYMRDDRLELMHLRVKRYFTSDMSEKIMKEYVPGLNYDVRGIMLHLSNGMNLYTHTSKNKHTNNRGKKGAHSRERRKVREKKPTISLNVSGSDYKTERHIATPRIKMDITPKATVTEMVKVPSEHNNRAILIIQNTDQPDVYKLYAKKAGVNRRVSYAHVPSLEVSKMLSDLFIDDTDTSEKLVECEYNSLFDKWAPLKKTVGTVDSVSTVKSIKRSIKK